LETGGKPPVTPPNSRTPEQPNSQSAALRHHATLLSTAESLGAHATPLNTRAD